MGDEIAKAARIIKDEGKARILSDASPMKELLEALRNLHNDCLASDFNEHWDSYKNAEAAIAKASPSST